MRWEFEHESAVVRCVRAVDTATHPDYQGRGIFRRLTLAALPAMADDGVQFVFNTPNSQSLPGYLKMGWQEIGRARACVRPLSVRGGLRLARSRVAASHWSEPAEFGEPVAAALEDPRVRALVAGRRGDGRRFRTRTDLAVLAWRYATPILGIPRGGRAEGVRGRGSVRAHPPSGGGAGGGAGGAARPGAVPGGAALAGAPRRAPGRR